MRLRGRVARVAAAAVVFHDATLEAVDKAARSKTKQLIKRPDSKHPMIMANNRMKISPGLIDSSSSSLRCVGDLD